MALVLKSLLDCRETFSMLKSIIIKFWVTEIVPDEWNIGRLIVLPKSFTCFNLTAKELQKNYVT